MPTSEQQRLAAESLYRDANSLLYADNKPSEEAIDRVVGKINREYVHLVGYLPHIDYSFGLFSIDKKSKFSRKRPNQDDGDITYINERNRVFNKKVISNHTLAHPPLFFTHYPVMCLLRLQDSTTNTQRKSVPASNVEQLCKPLPHTMLSHEGSLWVCYQSDCVIYEIPRVFIRQFYPILHIIYVTSMIVLV